MRTALLVQIVSVFLLTLFVPLIALDIRKKYGPVLSSNKEAGIEIIITHQSPETKLWVGNVVDRCLSSPGCRFEHNGKRIAFYGLNAADLISNAPDGVSIQFDAADFQSERPVSNGPNWGLIGALLASLLLWTVVAYAASAFS